MDLFALILSRLEGSTPEWIALNHYGEPLLDPFFVRRVEMLRERSIPLALFTNGVLMKDELIDFLAEGGVHKVVFNFPSLEPSAWSRLMQMPERSYWKVRRAVESALTIIGDMPEGIVISVNGVTDAQEARALRIKEHFSTFGDFQVRAVPSDSEAGAVHDKLVQISSHAPRQRYGGCDRIARQLHISTEGKVYLCCQDYDQNVVLGDISEKSISEIMTDPLARQLRAEMFGLAPMGSGRLCLNCVHLRRRRFV